MHRDLVALLLLLAGINRVTARKIQRRLENVMMEDQLEMLRHISMADGLAWRNDWMSVARAWLLVHVSRWVTRMGGYAPPDDVQTILNGLVSQLRSAYETTVRNWIERDMSSRGILVEIARLQRSVSRAAWDLAHFSDPRCHDTHHFRYIIHAMRPTAGLGVPSRDQTARYEYLSNKYGKLITKSGAWTLHSAELFLKEPWRISAELLSCTIIDQDHTRTYGGFCFGFVLAVPGANVCVAATSDLAISNAQARDDILQLERTPIDRMVVVEEFLETLQGLYSRDLPSPDTILNGSIGGHNEVLILGTTTTSTVTVSAIFIKVTAKGMVWKTFLALDAEHGLYALIAACSRLYGYPVIAIPDDSGEASDLPFADWVKGEVKPKKFKAEPTIAMLPTRENERPRPRHDQPQITLGSAISQVEGHIDGHDCVREYSMGAIRAEAQRLIALGRTPEQVHRQLHSTDRIPHEIIDHAMGQLGYRNYM
jgi:hypothetical protein